MLSIYTLESACLTWRTCWSDCITLYEIQISQELDSDMLTKGHQFTDVRHRLESHPHCHEAHPSLPATDTPCTRHDTSNTTPHTFCFFFRHDSQAICTNVLWRFSARKPGCGVFAFDGSDRNGLSFVKSAGAEWVPLAPGLASSANLAGAGWIDANGFDIKFSGRP